MKTYQIASQVASVSTTAAVQTSPPEEDKNTPRRYHVGVNGGGSATVKVQGSDDNKHWLTLATITLTATDKADGFSADTRHLFVRADITAVSGGTVDAVLVA